MNDPIENSQLRSIVERIERLEEEKKTISDDIKEVYAEAKGNGYDVKVLRKLIALRKRDADERAEEEAILELYEQALGDLADTPLGRAAAPGFASRAPMDLSIERYSECVSRPAKRQNPSEGEVGSAVRAGAPESPVEKRAPAPSRKPYVLRPHCQHPEMCGSYGSKHCGECERAAKASEDDEAAAVPAFIRKTHDHAIGDQA